MPPWAPGSVCLLPLVALAHARFARVRRLADDQTNLFAVVLLNSRHLAFGGALTLDIALGQIAFNVQYQIAHRATDDHGLVQLLMLGL